jgi:hypothetical protein
MRYLGALQNKWGEVHTLFMAAFLAGFFLLFILIEPLLNSFFLPKSGQESPVIQAYLNRAGTNFDLQNQADNSNKKVSLSEDAQISGPQVEQGTLKTEKAPSPQSLEMPPNMATPPPMPAPQPFAFGAAPHINSPSSSPLIGMGSGFRSRPNAPPGPKKTTDTASDQALENNRKQVGQEFEKRQAQAELAQLMGSLESNEQYQCTLRGNSQNEQKSQGAQSELITRCSPATSKAQFLEWILKRLYAQELCAIIAASPSQGFQKKSCESL